MVRDSADAIVSEVHVDMLAYLSHAWLRVCHVVAYDDLQVILGVLPLVALRIPGLAGQNIHVCQRGQLCNKLQYCRADSVVSICQL